MVARLFVRLPIRTDEPLALEPPKRGIDRPAGKARDVHDVEAELVTLRHGLKDKEACERKGWHVRIYIVTIRAPDGKVRGRRGMSRARRSLWSPHHMFEHVARETDTGMFLLDSGHAEVRGHWS